MTPIPVLCDQCRAAGHAGEAPFADLADLLAFTPVPRRPHANGWDEEKQRAFIAALVVTGSPARAARAIGKHAFGAQQLRKARGGSSFAAAWDAALELARERELAALNEGLAELAAEQVEENGRRRSAILPAEGRARFDAAPRPAAADPDPDPDDPVMCNQFGDSPVFAEAREAIRMRLTRGRRLLLSAIADDPAKRAAWEVLVGPTDWQRAAAMEGQDDEPFGQVQSGVFDNRMPRMRTPDMLLTAEHGYLAEFTGGPDALDDIRRQLADFRVAQLAELPPEEADAIAHHRAALEEEGWIEQPDGAWVGPANDP